MIATIILSIVLGFVMGIIFSHLAVKKDGRLIIDKSDYFIAITTKPEDLEKKHAIHLKVITK